MNHGFWHKGRIVIFWRHRSTFSIVKFKFLFEIREEWICHSDILEGKFLGGLIKVWFTPMSAFNVILLMHVILFVLLWRRMAVKFWYEREVVEMQLKRISLRELTFLFTAVTWSPSSSTMSKPLGGYVKRESQWYKGYFFLQIFSKISLILWRLTARVVSNLTVGLLLILIGF